MTCRQQIDRSLLPPKHKIKVIPIGTNDLLVAEGGTRFNTPVQWWKKLLKIKRYYLLDLASAGVFFRPEKV